MTVKELKDLLDKFPPETKVGSLIRDYDFGDDINEEIEPYFVRVRRKNGVIREFSLSFKKFDEEVLIID